MELTRTVEPTVEPVTADEAKRVAGIDTDTHDVEIEALIVAARTWAESTAHVQLLEATYVLKLKKFSDPIELPVVPVIAVDSVKYVDSAQVEQTLATTVYEVVDSLQKPTIIRRKYDQDWPTDLLGHKDDVRVTFRAGYGTAASDVPEEFRQAILYRVAAQFDADPEALEYSARLLDSVKYWEVA